MIYVYHCYRGAHMSVAAAALHLGLIHPDSSIEDILKLTWFDRLSIRELGVPVLAGTDSSGNQVYFLGLGRSGKVFEKFMESLVHNFDLRFSYKAINCLKCIAPITRLGGFLTRFPWLRPFGRHLAAWGVKTRLKQLEQIVLQGQGL